MIKNTLTLLILFLFMSCQKQEKIEKKHTQFLKINFCASPNSFHPHLCTESRGDTIANALFEGLTRLNVNGETELALAEKIDISPCKKIYTFTIRNSKWSNGKDVTSYDFVRGWKRALSPQSFCARFFFLIKNARKFYEGKVSFSEVGIRALSSNQFVVELEHPASHFIKLINNSFYFPIYETNLEKEPVIFNGPFIIENFEIDKKLTLVSNPLYWDAKSVKLERIEITFVKDINTAFSMYEKGQLDWIGTPFSPIPIEVLKSIPNIKTKTDCSPFWIFFNLNNPKLQSANIRKALSCVIDRTKVVEELLFYQKKLTTVLPSQISNLNKNSFIENKKIEKGKALLEKGLKEIGVNKKDFEFTLKYGYGAEPEYEKIAIYLKNTWEKTLGIRVTLRKEEVNSFYSDIRSGNYEVGGYYLINACNDPYYLMELFEKASTNHSKWENKAYQTYFSLAKQSIDEEQRNNYLKKAEEILTDELPVIPICINICPYTSQNNLNGFEPPSFAGSDFKWAYFDD